MSDAVLIALYIYLPITAVCFGFYAVGTRVRHTGLATWLKRSALVWGVSLFSLISLAVFAGLTCDGSLLYGFRDCTYMSADMAEFSQIAAILSLLAGAAFGLCLAVIGSVVEWRTRVAQG